MIRNVLTHISGVELYGIASVALFFAFFLGVLVWAFRLKRRDLEAMGRLPLQDQPETPADSNPHPRSAHE